MDKATASLGLRIGDFVTFKNIKHESFLSAEGILLEDLIVEEHVTVFDDCIFAIHLQRQYSASRELEVFLRDNADMKVQDASTAKYLQALKRGADNENKLNDSYLKKKTGEPVLFGDIIQLYHVKSGKYLTSIPDQLAKVERENIQMILDANGSACSYIKISPRYKIDREGDRVLSNSDVYLVVAERTNEYVHRADRDPFPGCDREVNCSLEPTAWHLSIFQSTTDSVDKSILLASQLVYINDPENRCNLTIAIQPASSLDDPHEDVASTPHKGLSRAGTSRSLNDDVDNFIQDDNSSFAPDDREFFHEFGDIILEPIGDILNSNILWFIELESVLLGGPIKLKTDKVRFKHMNTSLYLRQDFVERYAPDGTVTEDCVFTTCANPDAIGTLFSLTELNSTGKFLSNNKALQIGHGNIWIERGDVLDSNNFIVKGTILKSQALSLIVTRYSSNNNNSDEVSHDGGDGLALDDSTAVGLATSKEPQDVYVGLSARKYFRKYFEMTELPTSDSVNTLWLTSNRHDLTFFEMVIEKTIYFSQGFPISSSGVQLGIDKGDASLCTQRQNLLREQGSLEVVLRMINKLIPITEKIDIAKNIPAKRRPVLTDAQHSVNAMGQLLLSKCFELLYYSILNNEQNQMYVADFMPVLLAHLSAQPLAGKCVTEMLSKNLELQETKIGTREIQIFVDKLRSSKMNAMYLQLLQACCSCEGEGVDGNQCKVATMLFSDTNDIIIHLHAEYTRQDKSVKFEPSGYYITPTPGSPVRGWDLLKDGVPNLALAWTTNSIDFSPLGLFGKLSVDVKDLFKITASVTEAKDNSRVLDNGGSKAKSKKKSSEEQKAAVANYFIAEMYLGAEMCMDRNYIAMHKLDPLFPFEVLVSIIRMNVSDSLRAAAVRLLMCLHVDRDPQATSKIPRLTRTYSEVQANETPQLPYVDAGRRNIFGLIQVMVAEHVNKMAGVHWNDLSRHMLAMLRMLIEFNFYGNVERMNDVIRPLILALDRKVVSGEIVAASPAPIELANAIPASTGLPADGVVKITVPTEQGKEDLEATGANRSSGNPLINCLSSVTSTVMQLITGNQSTGHTQDLTTQPKASKFTMPLRYNKAPIHELETMVEAVDILAFAQRVIDDRNLSLLLRYFHDYDAGRIDKAPSEIFRIVTEVDSHKLTLDVVGTKFNDVMIDVLMFNHTPLVQSTLEILMAHHSQKRTLLDNARDMQLLVSHQRERQYKIVDQMLQQLEQNAETHELWGELETDADHAVNKQTKDILKELIDICRVRRYVLEFDEEFEADRDIQNLYRNLGCFDICMKVLGLLDTSEGDDDEEEEKDASGKKKEQPVDEVAENTRELCLLSNNLLYWFFLGNEKNQALGFLELDFFASTLDMRISSHQVIKSIFKMNEALMRQVPHKLLNELVDRIIKKGMSPHYLVLFSVISHAGERNIVENQFEIVKLLTSPGRLQKVGCFFCSVDEPAYTLKRELMAPYLNARDLALDDMPPLLAYHLVFLEVLSGCTVGRDISTVEAKVQSVFTYVDQIQSILDPGTIVSTKTRLSRFFYNCIIEVDLKVPGLEQSPLIWTLLESYRGVLGSAKDEILMVERLGWESMQVSRQRIEYIVVCIQIIGGFFTHYYNEKVFTGEEAKDGKDGKNTQAAMKGSAAVNNSNSPAKGVNVSLTHVDELIMHFFREIKDIYDLDSRRLSYETKCDMYTALISLNNKLSNGQLIANHIREVNKDKKDRRGVTDGEDSEFETAEDEEKMLTARFNEFLTKIEEDSDTQKLITGENVAFIKLLEALPYVSELAHGDVRQETLMRKLVSHIRENIRLVDNQKRLDARVTKTAAWIIKAFRTMIENKMQMGIDERDEEGGAEQDEAAAPVVGALNSCGATMLCLDLIADGIDSELQLEAIKLGVGLLFKEGGALEVQTLMNNHLSKGGSELFFKQVRITLQKLQEWHAWQHDTLITRPTPPPSVRIVRFLQLMCEGHYLPNQDIMREQPNNHTTYNLLDSFVNYLNCLSADPCYTSTDMAIRMANTILEVIQGPCEGNQKHFALNTELIETLNRINRCKLVRDCEEEPEVELKKISIDIFQGLLEGQGERSLVYERVLSVVHLDIIQLMSKKQTLRPDVVPDLVDGKPVTSAKDAVSEDQVILQTECVVLLQMLCNFKPSLYKELGISEKVDDIVGSGTAMIEIIWRGDIHRRFFHVPNVCKYLAKSSKDALVENVDRSNAENKLIDFLNRSHELYKEVKHQEYLTQLGISRVFSRSNQDTATWITFALAFAINLVMLMYYTTAFGNPSMQKSAEKAIFILNTIQLAVAVFVLILFLVVRIPVKYESLVEEKKYSNFYTILYTAAEPMTLYYLWYLAFTVLGGYVSYDFLPFLLLDIIVKNSTTRDVLNAVIVPRNQIIMGGVVILFIVQIYSFFLFLYFRDDLVDQGEHFCRTLYGCYKVGLGYGLRNGGGVGDVFVTGIDERFMLDVSYYFLITVGMLNLIGGVIITTFGQLREDKARLDDDTENLCFICAIDKQQFDRASEESDGFKTHITIDHNMWNYLYFIFLLWEQDKDDDDGLEQYVRRAIESNEIVWFPLNQAIRLDQAASKEESLLNDLKRTITTSESNVLHKLDKFQGDINLVLEQLNQALKQDHQMPERDVAQPSRGRHANRVGQVFNISMNPFQFSDNGGNNSANSSAMSAIASKTTDDSSNTFNRRVMLLVDLRYISGLKPPTPPVNDKITVWDRFYCLVTLDSHTFTIACKYDPTSSRYVFTGTDKRFRLVDSLMPFDRRIVKIQFGYEFSLNPASRVVMDIASLEVDELSVAEGALFDVFFTPPGQSTARGKVTMFPTCVKV